MREDGVAGVGGFARACHSPPVKPERESIRLRTLFYAECGQVANEDAKGWRALVLRSLPEDQPEVGVFCPECAEREFGRTTR